MKFKINETGEIRDITLDNRTFYVDGVIATGADGQPAIRETVQVMRCEDAEDVTESLILCYDHNNMAATRDPENGVCYAANQATVDFWSNYARTNAADMDRLQALYDQHHEDSELWYAMSETMSPYLNAPCYDVRTEHRTFEQMFNALRG